MSIPKIAIIASYAKSGSNWTRLVLENYLSEQEAAVDIFSKGSVFNYLPRYDFEKKLLLPSKILTAEELYNLLPSYFRAANNDAEKPVHYKLHDANVQNMNGEWIFPADVVLGAVYLIRNPLDVVVSFSHHFGHDIDRTIERLQNSEAMFNSPSDLVGTCLPICSLTWQDHVFSWINEKRFPVTVVRYEDLLENPVDHFSKVLMGLGCVTIQTDRLLNSIKYCSLNHLRKQEKERG